MFSCTTFYQWFLHTDHVSYGYPVKHVRVPCATVGPEEPHAASTAWPDGILEKQDFDLLNFESERTELEAFLGSKLPPHPKLYRGQLKNGLRYLILPNKVPLNRYSSSTIAMLMHLIVHSIQVLEFFIYSQSFIVVS